MTPDPLGAIIGVASIVALVYLWRNADIFSNGNVGSETDGE